MFSISDLIAEAKFVHMMSIVTMLIILVLFVVFLAMAKKSARTSKKVIYIALVLLVSVIGSIAGVHSYNGRTQITATFWEKVEETYGYKVVSSDPVQVPARVYDKKSFETLVVDQNDREMVVKFAFDGDNCTAYTFVEAEPLQ